MTPRRLFVAGAARSVPIILSAGPFGALFGALAIENGLTAWDALAMSLFIFAGASQLVGLELFGQHIPGWIIVMSIFAVNFRHILYSAAIGHHFAKWSRMQQAVGYFFLIDPTFAESEQRAEKGESIQFSWYLGLVTATYLVWNLLTWLGAIFGNFLQDSYRWGIDFILPIYFMGLVLGFRRRSFWLPVVVVSASASILASKTIGSPWHVSVGATAGVLLAAFFSPAANKASQTSKATSDGEEG